MGRAKAAVFPDPVTALPQMSRPANARGIHAAWGTNARAHAPIEEGSHAVLKKGKEQCARRLTKWHVQCDADSACPVNLNQHKERHRNNTKKVSMC